jgi:YHS domain-containing protein
MRTRLITISIAAILSAATSFAQPDKKPDPTPPKAPAPPAPKKDDATDPTVKRDTSNYNLDKNHLAIEGYDPVAYFPEGGGKPLKGSDKFTHTHRGVTYRFANQANLDAFKKDPNKYEPTYGGWCASAMADGGRKVEIDPENFKVTNGRLFLFYKSLFQNALDYWKKDEKGHTKEADDWWKKVAKEEPRKAKPTEK